MRTLGLHTKVLAFVAAALGLVASLSLPWYGPSLKAAEGEANAGELEGPVKGFFSGVWRWFSDPVGTDGWTSLQVVDQIFSVVAALAVVAAIAVYIPGLERLARSGIQLLALVAVGAAVVPFFDQPGDNTLVEPRHGWVLALGCAAVMFVSASHIANAKLRRAPAPTMTSMHDTSLRRS